MTPAETSQYFSEQPSGPEVRRSITARVWGRELKLITASGVFAAIAIRATCGIEALVWLTDVAQLSRRDASALMRSSAQALLNAALAT